MSYISNNKSEQRDIKREVFDAADRDVAAEIKRMYDSGEVTDIILKAIGMRRSDADHTDKRTDA